MNTRYPFTLSDRPIAYIRQIKTSSLPQELQERVGQVDRIYSIHDEEGDQLALVSDRRMAFVMARQNDMEPVSVH